MKCHWCKQFLSDKTKQATLREPDIFYCPRCWDKGVDMENEAMGLYDAHP